MGAEHTSWAGMAIMVAMAVRRVPKAVIPYAEWL
jgi:hypothetical protein